MTVLAAVGAALLVLVPGVLGTNRRAAAVALVGLLVGVAVLITGAAAAVDVLLVAGAAATLAGAALLLLSEWSSWSNARHADRAATDRRRH